MGSKDAPSPPDYSGIAAASEQAAEIQAAVALEQLDWTREMWADQKAVLDEVVDTTLPMMKEQWETAKADRTRYEELYQPMEEEYLRKASGWDTPERRADEAARAQSQIAQQFDAQRKQALQRLESYGVDPGTTRNQALDLGVRIEQAKAMAGGADAARKQVEREGMGMAGESINVGRGMASQGLQYAGTALQATQPTMQGAAGWQGASNAMGSPQQWMAGSDRSLGTWGNALTAGYQGQLGAYQAEAANNPLNIVAGLGGAWLGGGAGMPFAAGGEAAIPNGPMDGEIDGPGGPKDDAINAYLSDGEYVVPAEVVRRKGTEFFDKLIEKTHKDLAEREQRAQVAPNGMALPPPTEMPAMACGGEAVKMEAGGLYEMLPWARPKTTPSTEEGYTMQDYQQAVPVMDLGRRDSNPWEQPQRAQSYGDWAAQKRQQEAQRAAIRAKYAPEVIGYEPADQDLSDARQWLHWRRAKREQEAANAAAMQRYQEAYGKQSVLASSVSPTAGAQYLQNAPQAVAIPEPQYGAARMEQRIQDLRTRLPALREKHGIKS